MKTNDLIDALASDARPVRRLHSPMLRTALWLALAALVFALLALEHGLRTDLARQLGQADFRLALAAAVLTGLLAAVACFQLNLPDRTRAWGLLPLPALALWIGSVGYGCLTDWVALGPDGMELGETVRCFATVLLTSVPLSLSLFAMLRRGAVLRPNELTWMGSLAVAAFSAAAMTLFHAVDASALVLLWNFGVAASVVVVGVRAGRRALAVA